MTRPQRGRKEHKSHRQDRRLLVDSRLGKGSKAFSKVRGLL